MVDYQIIDFQPTYFEKVSLFWENNGLGGSHRGDSLQIIVETLKSGGHLLLMIDDKQNIIGTSWLTNDKRRTYIHHFGIREDCRRKGLAGILLECCLAYAKMDGYQVKLEVHRDNIPAQNLYRKYGFSDLGDYQVLIMRKLTS